MPQEHKTRIPLQCSNRWRSVSWYWARCGCICAPLQHTFAASAVDKDKQDREAWPAKFPSLIFLMDLTLTALDERDTKLSLRGKIYLQAFVAAWWPWPPLGGPQSIGSLDPGYGMILIWRLVPLCRKASLRVWWLGKGLLRGFWMKRYSCTDYFCVSRVCTVALSLNFFDCDSNEVGLF